MDATALADENGSLHHWRSLVQGEARVAGQAAMFILLPLMLWLDVLCCGVSLCVTACSVASRRIVWQRGASCCVVLPVCM